MLNIIWGVTPIVVSEYSSSDEIPEVAISSLRDMGFIDIGKKFVITGGVPVGVPGTTNYLSVLRLR